MYLSRPGENLENHINLVIKNYNNLSKTNNVDKILKNMIIKINNKENLLLDEILINDVLVFHDEGKKNKYFQSYVGNDEYRDIKFNNENKVHSILSAYYFLELYMDKINKLIIGLKGRDKVRTRSKLKSVICACAYIISKHHGDLQEVNVDKMLNDIKEQYNRYPDSFENYNKSVLEFYAGTVISLDGNYELYMFIKYLYSVLITCDYMAVYEFYQSESLPLNIITDKKRDVFKSDFEANNIVENIRKGDLNNMSVVNRYRSEMFLESQSKLKIESNYMYYLEAPTGCGKSITSLNLALNLLNDTHNKIYYVAPFINIIEQTYEDINNILGENSIKDVALVNSKEEIISEDSDLYEEEYLSSQMLNYPITVLSHVRLFDMLFSNRRKHNLMMPLLSNSVIILDEIQSYRNEIWIDIINTLKEFSESINLKIIIMSATLPKLDKLLDGDFKISSLIDNKKYYYDFFKTRCDSDFSLLDKGNEPSVLYDKVDEVIHNGNKHRILIGLISIKTCNQVFKEMQKYREQGFEVFKIQGGTNSLRRKYIVDRLKEKDVNGEYKLKKVILVATQCIEAGVDIDMNIGFKNISILDSDEQFMGRIERNFKNKGVVYYFKIDGTGKIYENDYRSERTLENKEWQHVLEKKDFDKFYERNYMWLLENEKERHIKYINFIKNLKFKEIYDNIKLITNNIKVDVVMEFEYIMPNNSVICYNDLFSKYQSIYKDFNIGYAEKQIKLKQIKKLFDVFTYSINTYDIDKIDCLENKNGINFISGASRFFDNTKDGMVTCESELNLDRLFSHYDIL